MVGKFNVILTGTEVKESKDGDKYYYVNLLQNSEIKRVRVIDKECFVEMSKIAPLTNLEAELEITEGTFNNVHYTRYSLVSYLKKQIFCKGYFEEILAKSFTKVGTQIIFVWGLLERTSPKIPLTVEEVQMMLFFRKFCITNQKHSLQQPSAQREEAEKLTRSA